MGEVGGEWEQTFIWEVGEREGGRVPCPEMVAGDDSRKR